MPSGSGHLIGAGSTFGGGGGAGLRAVVRFCCAVESDAPTRSANAATTLAYRMMEVYPSPRFAVRDSRFAIRGSRFAVRYFVSSWVRWFVGSLGREDVQWNVR